MARARGGSWAPRAALVCVALAAASSTACGPKADARPASEAPPSRAPAGPPIEFRFESLDDHDVSREALSGRASIVVFLTTYGDASIVQARYVKKVFKEFVPRINAAGVFLERAENRPLARIFRDAVGLPFPLAMADAASIAGKGPFQGLDTVPTVVVLDPQGREVWRKTGIAAPEELARALKEAQSSVWGPRLRTAAPAFVVRPLPDGVGGALALL